MSLADRRRRTQKLEERVNKKFAETDLPSSMQERVIEATRNPFTWVTQYTKTADRTLAGREPPRVL